MNIQIFGTKKNNDSKKAERYFKERNIKYSFIDMKSKGMSAGELKSVINGVGGIDNLINHECKDKQLIKLTEYISDDTKFEKMLEYPELIKVPVVRNGKRVTTGYMPDVWKGWE